MRRSRIPAAGRSWGRTFASCPGRQPSPTTSPRRAGSLMQKSEGEARWGREVLLRRTESNGISFAPGERFLPPSSSTRFRNLPNSPLAPPPTAPSAPARSLLRVSPAPPTARTVGYDDRSQYLNSRALLPCLRGLIPIPLHRCPLVPLPRPAAAQATDHNPPACPSSLWIRICRTTHEPRSSSGR